MTGPQFLRQPAEMLSYLSSLSAAQKSGEVLFQKDERHAKVYLHNGKIVWAFASGQEESFQSILIKEKHLSKETLLVGIKEARKQGKKSLDEILLALGVTNPEPREHIIDRHTRAALKEICNWQECITQFNSYDGLFPKEVRGLTLEELLDKLGTPPDKDKLRYMSLDGSALTAKPQAPVEPPSARPSYKPEIPPETISSIPQALERLRSEIPNFIAAMLIECKTGMPIATLCDAPEMDVEAVSAFYRDVSKSSLLALQAMGKANNNECPLEEVLISSTEDYVLLRTLHEGQHLLYVLIDSDSNPGMARVVIRRYLDQINALL